MRYSIGNTGSATAADGNDNTFTGGESWTGSQDSRKLIMSHPYTLSNFIIHISTNSNTTDGATFTIGISNTAFTFTDTTLIITLAQAAGTFQDITNTAAGVAFSAVSVRYDQADNSAVVRGMSVCVESA